MVAAAIVGALPNPGLAAAGHQQVCSPIWVGNAGFSDVSSSSPHAADIDCIRFWGITNQSGTYGPTAVVTRWQMALFMTRTVDLVWMLPSGSDQGFRDLGGLSQPAQTAINQVRQLDITTGTTPSRYGPYDPVSRWQMALFLTRLVAATGTRLPSGVDQGFEDISHLDPGTRTAINQVRQLGITFGTSATTYSPEQSVTREQMASFLARTLGIVWSLDTTAIDLSSCDPALPADPSTPLTPGTVCRGTGDEVGGAGITVREGWFLDKPASTADTISLFDSGTKVELRIDGRKIPMSEKIIDTSGLLAKSYQSVIPGGFTGVHTFEILYYREGTLTLTNRIEVAFH